MATTFITTTPDDATHTRTSKTKVYTHAVAVYSEDTETVVDADGNMVAGPDDRWLTRSLGWSWGVVAWSSTFDLAQRQADLWERRLGVPAYVYPVVAGEPK